MLSQMVRNILRDFAEAVIKGIQENIRTKDVAGQGPMNASGKFADSLKYRIDDSGLVIYSTEQYFTVLETGRGPTKEGAEKGNPTVRENVLKWIDDKGIVPKDISKESLAYLISRKIHEEGSLLYRRGGKSGVISDYINDTYIQENLVAKLTTTFRDYVVNEFIKKSIES